MSDTSKSEKDHIDEKALATKQTLKYAEDLARTYGELQISENRYRTLWEINLSLYQFLNIDDLISHIILRIIEMMEAETMSVALYDEKKDDLVFCWSGDIKAASRKSATVRFPADQGIAGSVFKNGKAELILDVANDSRHCKEIDDVTKFKSESMIAVPLKTKEKTIGVLKVINKKKGNFDKEDMNFLIMLSPIIAMALDNATMYTELNDAYNKLQLINKGKDDLIKQTKHEVALLRKEVEGRYRFDEIIGNSEPMLEVFKLCERIFDSDKRNIFLLLEGL